MCFSVKVCSKRGRHFLLTFLLKQTITDKKTKQNKKQQQKKKLATAKYITKSVTYRINALYWLFKCHFPLPLLLKDNICTLKHPPQEGPATKPSLFLLFQTTEKRHVSHFIITCMELQLGPLTFTVERAKYLTFPDIKVLNGLWWRET